MAIQHIAKDVDINGLVVKKLNDAMTVLRPVHTKLLTTPQRWSLRLLKIPTMQLADMSPDVLIASSFLPGKPPRDPTDRIIAATARDYGCTLMKRDRALLDYGEQGHISVVAC